MKYATLLDHPTIVRLPKILLDLAGGEIRMPRFQRGYVWTDDQRLDLFRSIYQGMPIGSLLIWRTRTHELASFARIIEAEDSTGVPEPGGVKQYLLDGLQRLTTLAFDLVKGLLLAAQTEEKEAPELFTGFLEIDEARRHVHFDLEERDFKLELRGRETPDTWIPLSVALSPYDLRPIQDRLSQRPNGRILVNRSEDLVNRFKDYTIPIIPIASEDLELVTESFQRVNSAGTKMDEVNMVNVLHWSPDFDINSQISEIRSKLDAVGWGNVADRDILSICKVGLDLDFYGTDIRELKKALIENPDLLNAAGRHLQEAAEFLADHCRILGPAIVPYKYHAILLADCMRIASEDSIELTAEVHEKLVRWVWLTTYGEYFAGINYSKLRQAIEHLRSVVLEGADPSPPDLVPTVRPWPRFNLKNARSRALLLRMAELDPRGPQGESQDAFRLLAEHGGNATPKLLTFDEVNDRKALEGVENRILADPKNTGPLRNLLRASGCDRNVLRSHGIDDEAATALRAGGFRQFLSLRRDRLAATEQQFVLDLGFAMSQES